MRRMETERLLFEGIVGETDTGVYILENYKDYKKIIVTYGDYTGMFGGYSTSTIILNVEDLISKVDELAVELFVRAQDIQNYQMAFFEKYDGDLLLNYLNNEFSILIHGVK